MDYTNEIYEGQKKINGQLCRVDWKLIEALRAVMTLLEQSRPPLPSELLQDLRRKIEGADYVSRKVAEIKPPGCEPELREDQPYTPPTPAPPQPTGV